MEAGAAERRAQYQDLLLNNLRRARVPVEVLCFGGIVLTGVLRQFDTFSLILDTPDGEVLVFKHGVITLRQRPGTAAPPTDGPPGASAVPPAIPADAGAHPAQAAPGDEPEALPQATQPAPPPSG